MASTLQEQITQKALALGFSVVGFASATLPAEAGQRLDDFIAQGYHGDMAWLADRAAQRRSPNALWPEAKSVVVLGFNYAPDHNPLDNLAAKSAGNISVYARHRDYHDVVKKQLRVLATWMAQHLGGDVKIFVDTAPVMEKPLAQQAGLGWQGKHTNIVSREFGSWLFLGEIFTTLDLATASAMSDHCGGCARCMNICPTKAIIAPYKLDARRCLSYLSIEYAGPIPLEFRKAMGNRIYGCDDCLSICPWNKFAQPCTTAELQPKAEHSLPPLHVLAGLDDAAFRARFSGSPVKRIGRNRFIRNVLIAIGNSDDKTLLPAVLALLNDPAPVVRGSAVWALKQLCPHTFAAEKNRATQELDNTVLQEWQESHCQQRLIYR